MLQLCREADLSEEPLGAEDGRKLRAEHLERDGAIVLEIAGEIDRGHATAAELALDRVTAREGGLKAADEIAHRGAAVTRASAARPSFHHGRSSGSQSAHQRTKRS